MAKAIRYYKAARPDGWDFYTGKTINYRENTGQIVKCPDQSSKARLCSNTVLHASKTPLGVFVSAKIPCSLFCVEGTEVCDDAEKSGFKELRVLYEIPQINLNRLFGFNCLEASSPICPFKIEPPKISDIQLALLYDWASVRASVWASVGDSVWASVGDSVWASVRASVYASVRDSLCASVGDSVWASVGDSVWDSVWDSVRDSLWAYVGSLFPNVTWKHCEKINKMGYLFQSAVDLWKMGIVPSYDGKTWRLHTKHGIVWEGDINGKEANCI